MDATAMAGWSAAACIAAAAATGCVAAPPLLLLLLLVLLLVVLLQRSSSWGADRARRRAFDAIPGFSVSLPLLGDLPHLVRPGRPILLNGMSMFDRFGPTWRIWLGSVPFVALSRPEDFEAVISSGKFNSKPQLIYGTVETLFGRGLATLNGATWRRHRKHLTQAFHFRVLEQYVEVFNRKALTLVDKLRPLSEAGGTFNVFPQFAFCTNDTIFETAFGLDEAANRAVDPAHRQAFVDAMEFAFEVMQARVLRPWLLVDWIFRLTADGRRFQVADGMIDEFADRVIRERRAKMAHGLARGQFSFLDLIDGDDHVLSDAEIRGELRTFISVQQTSATIMSFAMVMLALHPDVQRRVLEEAVDELGAADAATYSSLTGLKFLERVIKETMRLYPVLPVFARDVTEDVHLVDATVPAGCCIAVAPFRTQRDPAIWTQPLAFDPDRFLPDRSADRHPYSYLPFSAGARNCIGQKYAMLQMKAVLATLLRRFEVLPGKGCSTMAAVEAQLDITTFITLPGGFNVRLCPRDLAADAAAAADASRSPPPDFGDLVQQQYFADVVPPTR